jgi:hypothetical protein
MVVEDASFSQERREARRVGKLLFDLLMPSIADVGKAIRDADNLMSFGLAFTRAIRSTSLCAVTAAVLPNRRESR